MKTKIYYVLLAAITLLVVNSCSNNDDDPPGKKTSPFNFNETEKNINYQAQNVVFTTALTNCCVGSIREGSDALIYPVLFPENKNIEGDWYKIDVNEGVITVHIFENKSGTTRELMLNMMAGNSFGELKIIQDKE